MGVFVSAKSLSLFDRLTSALKRLCVESDLNEDEASTLAGIVDDVNEVREQYTERRLDELEEQADDA